MLQTINGIDLLLVLIIIGLLIRNRLLYNEAIGYIKQIIKASDEIQELKNQVPF
jgi:hypothetical protein